MRLVSAGCLLALSIFGVAAADQISPAEPQRDEHAANQLSEGVAAYQRGDYVTAMRLLQPLADQGVPLVQFTLGAMYADGKGTPQDYGQAVTWFRKAADQGYDQAQGRLGLMYFRGQGVPQDYVQAYFWCSLNGHDANAAEAKSHLSPSQIREAERLLKEWKEQHRLKPEVAAALHIEN